MYIFYIFLFLTCIYLNYLFSVFILSSVVIKTGQCSESDQFFLSGQCEGHFPVGSSSFHHLCCPNGQPLAGRQEKYHGPSPTS